MDKDKLLGKEKEMENVSDLQEIASQSGSCTLEQLSEDQQFEVFAMQCSCQREKIDKITKRFNRALIENDNKHFS